jgi:transposase-like protein
MRSRYLAAATTLALVLAVSMGPADAAKVCKDVPVTAKARSAAQVSDGSREKRARNNAIDNWSNRARDTYGYLYKFWWRAEEKKVECGGGASAKHCTVSARPCRVY